MNPNLQNYSHNNCPECDTKSWTISHGQAYGLVKIDSNNNLDISNDNILKILPVVCSNCGYTKFYMDGLIYSIIRP